MKQEYPTPLKHVAIIMDGNRRWAETKKLPSFAGHKRGLNTLKDIVKVCPSLDISYLTVYAFSTENWSRKEEEVKYLFTLFTQALKEEIDELKEQGVKLKFIGSKKGLNEKLKESMQFSEEITQNNSTLNLQVAFNYGSQTELVEAVQSIALEVKQGKFSPSDINKDLIQEYLYTKDIPPVDLLIRTGGEQRISNFLLWQSAYAEMVFSPVLWPDFTKDDLTQCLQEFHKRERRKGV